MIDLIKYTRVAKENNLPFHIESLSKGPQEKNIQTWAKVSIILPSTIFKTRLNCNHLGHIGPIRINNLA